MKHDSKIGFFKVLLVAAILLIPVIFTTISGCGGGDTTPVTLPAPTSGYIDGTAPDQEGNSLVYGFLYAEDELLTDTEVTATNDDTGDTESDTSDATGFFSIMIGASIGDTISVRYIDPVTGQISEPTEIIITDNIQQMTSTAMVPKDVDIDTDDGIAMVVANDGTDSELIGIDLTTGQVTSRTTFHNLLFERIAVQSALDYAAVLDTTADRLYWYDLESLSDDMAETSNADIGAESYDVAVADLDGTPYTTDELIVVSHDQNGVGGGFLSIFGIQTWGTPVIASATTTNCFGQPQDTTYYPNCNAVSAFTPLRATRLDMVRDSNNRAYLAMIAEYNNAGVESKVVHFVTFFQGGTGAPITLTYTAGTYFSELLDDIIDPYTIAWYDENTALMVDSTNALLHRLTASGTDAIDSRSISVGSQPMGVFGDSGNNRAFVADQTGNVVINIDMTNFLLSGTTYSANLAPTDLVYYEDATNQRVGTNLTSPIPLFESIDVSQ